MAVSKGRSSGTTQGTLPDVLSTTLTLVHHQFDLVVQLLDSRASRMSPNQALLTLHADYIGGQHANYRKWYFAAQLDLDGAISSTQNLALQRFPVGKWMRCVFAHPVLRVVLQYSIKHQHLYMGRCALLTRSMQELWRTLRSALDSGHVRGLDYGRFHDR